MFFKKKILRFGFSPCPNDLFAFSAIVHKKVFDLNFEIEPVIADIEELNERALKGDLEVTKISFSTLARVIDKYTLLRSGAALGYNCGPLLVARQGIKIEDLSKSEIAIPGKNTTAYLLLGMYLKKVPFSKSLLFSEIIPAVSKGEFDIGLIIHEGRFIYKNFGLNFLLDLGDWWEKKMGLPVPLGCIVVRSDLKAKFALRVERVVRRSIAFAWERSDFCWKYILEKSKGTPKEVLARHILTYVNDFSLDLDNVALRALKKMFFEGEQIGLLPVGSKEVIF